MARDGFSGYRKSSGWDEYWDRQEKMKKILRTIDDAIRDACSHIMGEERRDRLSQFKDQIEGSCLAGSPDLQKEISEDLTRALGVPSELLK